MGDPMNADDAGKIVQERFTNFLKNFEIARPEPSQSDASQSSRGGYREYLIALDKMKDNDQTTMAVNFEHLQTFDVPLSQVISEDYYRFEPYLRRGLQDLVREKDSDFFHEDGNSSKGEREFYVSFFNTGDVVKVRQLRMSSIGHLKTFCGTVTRSTAVMPELLRGKFLCSLCGTVSEMIDQQFKLTEPTKCSNGSCNNTNKWKVLPGDSKFGDWQRVRVQENSDEIPAGSMPRSVEVILRNSAVDKAKAGDRVFFTGHLAVVPDLAALAKAGTAPTSSLRSGSRGLGAGEGVTGLKELGCRDLTFRTVFIAQSVAKGSPVNLAHDDDSDENAGTAQAGEFTPEDEQAFHLMADSGTIYNDLVASVAPTISGHDEVKKGLLLMLMGGVHKEAQHKTQKLRGDLNVCIVGDPSTAKSQFLKYVHRFAARSVYTSGKASSAAGLTASVARDPDTGEFTVEAGALMLADQGICCIDEFDKMDPADQVAIHEAMEQQTISITKAGITATLNARTSVLAAANPVFGRYDRTKSLRHNVNISAPIMSRFDLFYVILDELDEERDAVIAQHIINVHARRNEAVADVPYPIEKVQAFVRFARTLKPELTEPAKRAIAHAYKLLRSSDALNHSGSSYRVTVRQLESLIRLSEALARVHLDDKISGRYVNEAFRLIKGSMMRAESGDVDLDGGLGVGDDDGDGGEEDFGLDEPAGNDGDDDQDGAPPPPPSGGGGDEGGGDDSMGGGGGQRPPPTPGGGSPTRSVASQKAQTQRKKKAKAHTKVSMETYRRMRDFFALRLRNQERTDLAAARDDEAASPVERLLRGAVTFGELASAWVEARASSVPYESEAERDGEGRLARKVLRRLLQDVAANGDTMLHYVNHTDATGAGDGEGAQTIDDIPEDERYVALAADYAIPGTATEEF